MFRKKCPRCGKKIKGKFEFCPYCGKSTKERKQEDYGLLGTEDYSDLNFKPKLPFGFNRLFNSLLKQMNKEFRELDKRVKQDSEKEKPKFRSKGISINISTGKGTPKIKFQGFGPDLNNFNNPVKEKPIKNKEISEEKIKKLSKLPRKEAKTDVRRFSDKIIYEINLPEIKNLEDIIINKLEKSTEIKGFGKKSVYFKLLPVSLPILNYYLKNGKLILELKSED